MAVESEWVTVSEYGECAGGWLSPRYLWMEHHHPLKLRRVLCTGTSRLRVIWRASALRQQFVGGLFYAPTEIKNMQLGPKVWENAVCISDSLQLLITNIIGMTIYLKNWMKNIYKYDFQNVWILDLYDDMKQWSLTWTKLLTKPSKNSIQ